MNRTFWHTKSTAVATLLWLAALGGGCGGTSTNTSGGVTASCTVASASICTQLLVPESEVSSETQTCTGIEAGIAGTGCATAALVGCCKSTNNPSNEEECYYSASAASTGQMVCTSTHGTWSSTL